MLVLVSSIVIRGSQDRALVGFWGVGLSLTMVGCVGALELGIPVPVHGLAYKTARGGQVPGQTLGLSSPSVPS